LDVGVRLDDAQDRHSAPACTGSRQRQHITRRVDELVLVPQQLVTSSSRSR
jgi:hypothetical protein